MKTTKNVQCIITSKPFIKLKTVMILMSKHFLNPMCSFSLLCVLQVFVIGG